MTVGVTISGGGIMTSQITPLLAVLFYWDLSKGHGKPIDHPRLDAGIALNRAG